MPEALSSTERSEILAAITTTLEGVARVGILTHRRPDGDAIGSSLAAADALRALGKEVNLVNEDRVPDCLRFLSGTEHFRIGHEIDGGAIEVDCLLVLDSAGEDRIGESAWQAFRNVGPVINIDHHISNTRFGDINLVDTDSPATGQIIFDWLKGAGWTLTEAARDALYVAISTDTGSFRYPSCTGHTYRIGAALIEEGLDLGDINRELYEAYPMRRLFLLRDLLENMEVSGGQRAVSVKLTRSMAESAGMEPGDTEGLIDVFRSIGTVVVAVFFEELPDGKIRVSSRSKSDEINVGEVCAVFGGGGHRLAAGARMRGPIDDAAERFMNEVEKRLDGND